MLALVKELDFCDLSAAFKLKIIILNSNKETALSRLQDMRFSSSLHSVKEGMAFQ